MVLYHLGILLYKREKIANVQVICFSTSSKKISISKCDVCNYFFFIFFEFLCNFWGIFLGNFSGGVFSEDFFDGMFLVGFFGTILLREDFFMEEGRGKFKSLGVGLQAHRT